MSLRESGLCATGRATLDAALAGERNPRSLADRAKAPAGRRPGRRKRHLRATFLHTSRSRLMPGLLTDTGS